jgi:poly(A) polymerase Pap1
MLMFLGAKSLDLSWQVDEFKRLCTTLSDKYDAEKNALAVAHVKKYPSDSRKDD